MATKDLSALPKQLGDVSQQLQTILGLFNSLGGVIQQFGNITQGAIGQTPRSANLAVSDLPDQTKQALSQEASHGPVMDMFGNRFNSQQISDFKKAQDAQTGRNQGGAQSNFQPTQQLISNSQHQQTFNPSSFVPQQQYGIKDIPRLMADLQKSSSLEEKASKQIDRLKVDPNNQLATNALQSTLTEFSKITTEIKALTAAFNKAEAGSLEQTRIQKEIVEKLGEQISKQDNLKDSLRGSQGIGGGGDGGRGGIRGFFERNGNTISNVMGGAAAVAHVGAQAYQTYLDTGIGYGKTIQGGESNLLRGMNDNVGIQARRMSESKNLNNYDNFMKYKGDQLVGSELGSMLGEPGEKRSLNVALREQNFAFDMMRREHESEAFGKYTQIGLGAIGAIGGIAAAPFTGGSSLLATLAGGAAIAGGAHAMFGGAAGLYKMNNTGMYNLLRGNLEEDQFGYDGGMGYARAGAMMGMRNDTIKMAEDLSKSQADAVRPFLEPGMQTHWDLVQGRRAQVSSLGEYAIGEDDMRNYLNPAGVATETPLQFFKRSGGNLPIQQTTKPEDFSVVPQGNVGGFPGLRMPVKSGILTGRFTDRRDRDGDGHTESQHNGVDIRARAGEDVFAPFADMSDVSYRFNPLSNHMQFLKKVGDKTYGADFNHVNALGNAGNDVTIESIRARAAQGMPIASIQQLFNKSGQDVSHLDMKLYEMVKGKKRFLDPEEIEQFKNQTSGTKIPGGKIIPNLTQNTSVNYMPGGDAGVFSPLNPGRFKSMDIIQGSQSSLSVPYVGPLANNTGYTRNTMADLMITPQEFQKYAGMVAQTMGPGAISRQGIMGRTAEVVNLSKAGLGGVEQLSQNLIDINKVSGGREGGKDLENIMAAAVAAGFDRSRLGQEFIQTSIQLSKSMDITSTKYISERLSGGMGFASPFGQPSERDLANTQRGMSKLHTMTQGDSGAIGAGKAYAFFAAKGKIGESAFSSLSTTQASSYLEELKSGKITSEDLQYQVNNIANMRGISQSEARKVAQGQISDIGKVGAAIPFQYMNQISSGRMGKLLEGIKGSSGKARTKLLSEFRDAAGTMGITTFGDSAVGIQTAQSMLEYSGVQLSGSDSKALGKKIASGKGRDFDKATSDQNEFNAKSFSAVSEKMSEALSKSTSGAINNLVTAIKQNLKPYDSKVIGQEIAAVIKEVMANKKTTLDTPVKK